MRAQWGKLNPHKLAKLFLCDKDGNTPAKNKDGNPIENIVVTALLTDGDLSVESQYQSPFENSNPESKLPNLLGMLQSGELAVTAAQLAQGDGLIAKGIRGLGESLQDGATAIGFPDLATAIESLERKTNLTQLNSTQIFVSTAPVKMSITLFFQAFKNAKIEVENPLKLLQQWALPEMLERSLIGNIAEKGFAGLFPSTAPPYVALAYGGKTYAPMFIESVSAPLVAPTDSNGNRLSLTVQVSLVSRQAWDASNINRLQSKNE